MLGEHTSRRLAAILAADVVGYSRMMGADDAGTLAALKHHRESLFDPTVAAHNGRVVKLIGDGTLVEFASVVDAVNCALTIQRALKTQAQQAAIKLRIGLNLGDVIIDGDDIYGDGVNIAARLEPLAEPGGICVSSIVNESVGNRVDAVFRDAGEVLLKNIENPIQVWKWHPDGEVAAERLNADEVASSPERVARPSIAVLPFDNMSGDPEQEYFSDGITEDIITDLSKVGGLMVIARNSSFAYKGKSPDVRMVGRELGVKSVLEGSIRRAGNRVRVTAQLIDAATGGHLWADRYDRELTEIFAVQDEVTQQIVAALKVAFQPADEEQTADAGTSNMEAYDLMLRARQLLFGSVKSREVFDQTNALLRNAIELDPDYWEPYAGLAWSYENDYHNRWTELADQSVETGWQLAEQALQRGPKEPFAHCIAAMLAVFFPNLDRARVEAEKAIDLNPSYALALALRGVVDIYAGDPLSAISWLESALRLDPAYSQQYLHFLGTAYLTAGKYETASATFKQRVLMVPDTDLTRAFLASALGHLGDRDEARRIWDELMKINPAYSFSEHLSRLPFVLQVDIDRISGGLANAGLPK